MRSGTENVPGIAGIGEAARAAYENFDTPEEAMKYLETSKYPIVLKADGLALGKGVLICNTKEEAMDGVKELMLDKKFGNAGILL